jgi:hypothetical protein
MSYDNEAIVRNAATRLRGTFWTCRMDRQLPTFTANIAESISCLQTAIEMLRNNVLKVFDT